MPCPDVPCCKRGRIQILHAARPTEIRVGADAGGEIGKPLDRPGRADRLVLRRICPFHPRRPSAAHRPAQGLGSCPCLRRRGPGPAGRMAQRRHHVTALHARAAHLDQDASQAGTSPDRALPDVREQHSGSSRDCRPRPPTLHWSHVALADAARPVQQVGVTFEPTSRARPRRSPQARREPASRVGSRCHADHGVCRSNGSLDRLIAGTARHESRAWRYTGKIQRSGRPRAATVGRHELAPR